MSAFGLSVLLGSMAGLANLVGGLLLVRRPPTAAALRLFVALGAGFMLSAALLEMVPESFALRGPQPALLILGGYCVVHLLEHTVVPHVHLDRAIHQHDVLRSKTGYSVLLGLATHTFFDGVAIGSGFVLSSWLGWMLFLAIFLHKVPEGVTVASVMLAAQQGRRAALLSAVALGVTTVAGVLVISAVPGLVRFGLPLSAGVAIYVAASDLVPEINRQPSVKTALVFLAGVTMFLLLRQLAPS